MIKFKATLPPIKSAILLDGNGDGGQVKLEVPRMYRMALIELSMLSGKVLNITVETDGKKDTKKSGGFDHRNRQF